MIQRFWKSRLGQQIMKFGAAGFLCFFIEWILLVLLKELVKLPLVAANTLAFAVSAVVNYILSISFIFETDKSKNRMQEFAVFFAMAVGGAIINNVVLYYGTMMLEKLLGRYAYMLMKAFAAGVVMIYNFITRKLVLEKNK